MTVRRQTRRVLAVTLALTALLLGVAVPDAGAAGPSGHNQFGQAPLLPPGNGVYTGHTAFATQQAGEPDHVGRNGGASVWWRYRRSTPAKVRITTRGSNFDTVLAVYRGGSLQNLAEVASNDDTPQADFLWSRVVFQAQPGVTYRIALDGYNGDSDDTIDVRRGAYKLRVTVL